MAEIYIQLSLLKPRETTPELSAVNYNLLAAKAVQCTWTFSQRCALSFRAKQMTLTIFNKYLVGSHISTNNGTIHGINIDHTSGSDVQAIINSTSSNLVQMTGFEIHH